MTADTESGLKDASATGLPVVTGGRAEATGTLDVRSLIQQVHELRKLPAQLRDWSAFAELMRQLCRARAAMVIRWSARPELMGQGGNAADWHPDRDAGFHEVCTRALANGHAFGPSMNAIGKSYLMVLVRVVGLAETLLCLYLDDQQRPLVNEMVLRAMLAADFSEDVPDPTAVSDSMADMIALAAEVMAQSTFSGAALALVNGVTVKFNASYASLGWVEGGRVRTQAISQLDRFDPKSRQVQLLELAFDEIRQRGHELWAQGSIQAAVPTTPLDDFAVEHHAQHVCGLPVRDTHGMLHAVLVCAFTESATRRPDTGPLLLALDLMQPRLADLHWQQQGWAKRFLGWSRIQVARLLGPEHTTAKLAALAGLLLLMYVFIGTWQHRIDATAQVTTDATRLVSAQYDGRVERVNASSGDLVKKDSVLLELDARELHQQAMELRAEIRRIEAEVGKHRASGNLSEMEIAQARLDQSRAKLARTEQYITQSIALAPFDGVVVEGERKDLLGAPVKKGEMLLRLAKVEGLYVSLMVPERDIRDVALHAKGELLLLSHPDQSIAIEVTAIIPVAQVKGQEGNHFTVTAKLMQAVEPWWRPGMTGLAKIEAGQRRVVWILTHKLVDNLRLMFWW